jgi:hypothetical protein
LPDGAAGHCQRDAGGEIQSDQDSDVGEANSKFVPNSGATAATLWNWNAMVARTTNKTARINQRLRNASPPGQIAAQPETVRCACQSACGGKPRVGIAARFT